jgi:hypothetical protein
MENHSVTGSRNFQWVPFGSGVPSLVRRSKSGLLPKASLTSVIAASSGSALVNKGRGRPPKEFTVEEFLHRHRNKTLIWCDENGNPAPDQSAGYIRAQYGLRRIGPAVIDRLCHLTRRVEIVVPLLPATQYPHPLA